MGGKHDYGSNNDKKARYEEFVKTINYLFSDRERIAKLLKNKFIYLFLDYDGTLSPIARTPNEAVMQEKTKDLLRQLSKAPNCRIAVVSGRAIDDISKRVGLKNIVYVGNHGFEIKGPKIRFKSFIHPRCKTALSHIKEKLTKGLSDIKGVLIEDKGFSLSVHYRRVNKNSIQEVKNSFYAAVVLHEARNDIKVRAGKMVLEIRPPIEWDKGKAVLWLLARQKFMSIKRGWGILPVYIGDDATDEDAFKALRKYGLTISVGKIAKTHARYYLRNTNEVAKLLELILREKTKI